MSLLNDIVAFMRGLASACGVCAGSGVSRHRLRVHLMTDDERQIGSTTQVHAARNRERGPVVAKECCASVALPCKACAGIRALLSRVPE